jgi:hypothetical protein
MNEFVLSTSNRKNKKWIITPMKKGKSIHFGQDGAEDYTIHKDLTRKKAYISRHKKRENWGKSGIDTAGFWSRWLLWNKPTLRESISSAEKKYRIKIHLRT